MCPRRARIGFTQAEGCKIHGPGRTGTEGEVMAEVVDRPAAAVERPPRSPEVRETLERLIDAISAHGPITARQLAERFGLTSAAVRRHLASLEADEVIAEHEMPVRNRDRKSTRLNSSHVASSH